MSPPASPGDDERAVLLNALADDLLTPAQESRLVELLRTDSGFRRDYVRFCQLTTHLIWSAAEAATSAAPMADKIRAQDCRRSIHSKRRWPLSASRSATVIVVLVLAGVAWQFLETRHESDRELITQVTGTILVTRANQQRYWTRAEDVQETPWELQPDDRIEVDPAGSAVVSLSDRTQIRIGSGTELIYAAAPEAYFKLLRGYLTANIAPQQTQKPLVLATPQASVQILGTELELLVDGERTEVAVTEGKVRVSRLLDGVASDVAAGEILSVNETGPLSVVRSPVLPEDWQADFEEGLPAGWTGNRVTTGLPAGSRGAAQGKPAADKVVSQTLLASPLVDEGLFGWHPDSMLQITFRVQPPAWFHICLETRTLQQAEPLILWCRVDPGLWQTKAGEWRTVRIPLAEFRQPGSAPPGTLLGRIPLRLRIVGPGDLPGVTIDSLRIDRSGLQNPGNQELIMLEGQP